MLSQLALVIRVTIGSRTFISPKGVLTWTESVGMSLVIWAGCGILPLLGSLCYCEMGTMILNPVPSILISTKPLDLYQHFFVFLCDRSPIFTQCHGSYHCTLCKLALLPRLRNQSDSCRKDLSGYMFGCVACP